jgi:hypothetical protein
MGIGNGERIKLEVSFSFPFKFPWSSVLPFLAAIILFMGASCAHFVWLISHQPTVLFSQNKLATSNQPTVLFSQNKLATSNQPTVLFSQNKPASAISHQPNEQTVVSLHQAVLFHSNIEKQTFAFAATC